MKLPKNITPDPIQEAIIEIRFESDAPSEVVLGIIYSNVKDQFEKLEKLEAIHLPDKIRQNDPNLKFQIFYRFTKDNYTFQFGPNVFSLIIKQPYTGWSRYSQMFVTLYKKICESNIIKIKERLAIRYIDAFNYDIFDKINVTVNLHNEVPKSNLFIRTVLNYGTYNCLLQIGNNVTLQGEVPLMRGSIIDIDTTFVNMDELQDTNIKEILDKGHSIQKELFYSLLKDEFLQTLNPVYEVD